MITVGVQKLNQDAILPTRGTPDSAGYDFWMPQHPIGTHTVKPHTTAIFDLGIAIMLPRGYCLQFVEKSGMSIKHPALTLKAGLIDSDYRGQLRVVYYNASNNPISLDCSRPYKIVQGVIREVHEADFIELESLDVTQRGEGGFGSTGGTIEQA